MKTIDKYNELIQRGKTDEAFEIQDKAFVEATKDIEQGLNIDEAMQKVGFEKSDELQAILDNVTSKAKEKNPYFPHTAPFVDIEKDDETIDDIFECDKYSIKPCLLTYYKELRRFEIDVLFIKASVPLKSLVEMLKNVFEYINENSDKPINLENKIIDFLQELNKYKGFGQVLQILILKGILKCFEWCNINESDEGYKQAVELCGFVEERFIQVCVFYFLYFDKNGNSRPLDNYLATDEMYRQITDRIEERSQIKALSPGQTIGNPQQQIILPAAILQALQENGYIESLTKPYKWIKSNKKTQGKTLNKKAIFDLLCLLNYPDKVITDLNLLNNIFSFANGKKLKRNNITYLISPNGKLERPIISEYHTELETIVNKSKEK